MLGVRRYRNVQIDLFQGDITTFVADAIVNAANAQLAGGGGVDGAIHRVGGPAIMEECRQIGGCPTGSAVVTGAGHLPARFVIHAVGPVWQGGEQNEAELLAGAYRSSLARSAECGVRHVSLPSLSTGTYRYPLKDAAHIALTTVRAFLEEKESSLGRITFVLFDKVTYDTFQERLFALFPDS